MKSALHGISRVALTDLAKALSAGWLVPPYSSLAVSNSVPANECAIVAAELERLRISGFTPQHLKETLHLMAAEREGSEEVTDRLELVWTGPDVHGSVGRDTGVIVRDLFSKARKSLLISTFTVRKGSEVFKPIALNQSDRPGLNIRIFVHIGRGTDYKSTTEAIVATFAASFWKEHWPWQPRPEVHYDPRGCSKDQGMRATLHAKCIVVDDEVAFVTSANFTEWAQERNIEAGVLIADPIFARGLSAQYDSLLKASELALLPGSRR